MIDEREKTLTAHKLIKKCKKQVSRRMIQDKDRGPERFRWYGEIFKRIKKTIKKWSGNWKTMATMSASLPTAERFEKYWEKNKLSHKDSLNQAKVWFYTGQVIYHDNYRLTFRTRWELKNKKALGLMGWFISFLYIPYGDYDYCIIYNGPILLVRLI